MRLINSIILCIIASCFALSGEAKTIRDIFTSEPDNVFMILPSRTRMDMLDYYDIGNKVAATNNLSDDDTTSQLITVTDNLLAVSLTDATEVDLQLLTSKSDSLVVVVQTAMLPQRDSHISFYDTTWAPCKQKDVFKAPSVKDFIKKSADKNAKAKVDEVVKFPIISYEMPAEKPGTLIAHLNIEEFLSKEDWDAVKDYLTTSLTYNFDGKRFKLAIPKD